MIEYPRKGFMQKHIIFVLIALLITVAYLVGRIQMLSGQPAPSVKQQTPTPTVKPTSIPKPTSMPAVKGIQNSPTPAQVPERKKVSVFIDDLGGITKGNYYCYEDKVNELANIQNDIRNYQAIADSCVSLEQVKAESCSSDCSSIEDINAMADCIHACWEKVTANCNDKSTRVGNLRKELYNKVHQYCP